MMQCYTYTQSCILIVWIHFVLESTHLICANVWIMTLEIFVYAVTKINISPPTWNTVEIIINQANKDFYFCPSEWGFLS
jgi:hypothetical protein